LNFFVKPLGKNTPKNSLIEFLNKSKIDSIQVDELRYELVSDDEVVVKSEILEEADLKAQISNIIKQNPDLVREVLLNKPLKQESYKEKLGTEVNLDQLTQGIHQQLKTLSDDELLSLLASELEVIIEKSKDEDKISVSNEVASLLNQLLQDREKKELLPEVKKILSGSGVLEEKYFDFIFDEKWLKSQTVLDELVKLMDELGKQELDFDRFMFLLHRVIDSEEEKIRLYALDRLLSNLDSENSETRRLSVLALKEILSRLISGKMEVEFVYLKDRLYDKIKDQKLTANIFKDCTALIEIIFSEMIQRNEFEEARRIISEYNVRLKEEVSCPEEIKGVARDFLKNITDESNLSLLTSQLKEGQPLQNTVLIEEILESLDNDKVAEKLLEIFTVDDRATRISSLRILSKLGRSSIVALSGLLSHVNTFSRQEETQLLIDEHWYKVRNAIYVLGNFSDPSSVEALVRLNSDPDPRVRLEAIKALEKIGKEECMGALLTFLKDKDDQVRKSVLTSLAMVGDRRCLDPLIDHFHHNRKDKLFALTAIGKIGGTEVIGFLLKLLSDEDPAIKRLSNREAEEIKITTLNILGRIGSTLSSRVEVTTLLKEIERLIKQRKKGIKGLFVKDAVAETAERLLKMMKNKAQPTPSPFAIGERQIDNDKW
jgi:HEAT repeat protein